MHKRTIDQIGQEQLADEMYIRLDDGYGNCQVCGSTMARWDHSRCEEDQTIKERGPRYAPYRTMQARVRTGSVPLLQPGQADPVGQVPLDI